MQGRGAMASSGKDSASISSRKILVLHGSRQTGQLLLGRMDKLRKKLQRMDITLVAPDAPFPHADDVSMRSWWARRNGNHCEGLEESMEFLQDLWMSDLSLEGILGFSQGARMAHLVALMAAANDKNAFKGLKYVIMVAGYDVPLPERWNAVDTLDIPSLHVWGEADKLITPEQSQAVLKYYRNPQQHVHEGGHHVPMRAANVTAYLDFIKESTSSDNSITVSSRGPQSAKPAKTTTAMTAPSVAPALLDEETAMAQQDEVEALSAIFPEEFTLLSKQIDDETYKHPIRYRIDLPESDMGTWPPHAISLLVEYPADYPSQSLPIISLEHQNNMMQFSSGHMQLCLSAINEAAETEQGMPCVLSCVYAARDFFESGGMEVAATELVMDTKERAEDVTDPITASQSTLIKPVSPERIQVCNLQGLEIARALLQDNAFDPGKGGSWKYTIGLVGKPSAGKSTFFNSATGFARQRNDNENALGGATMAPHPFTTIDPNVGYCLVPAPKGSCPEEDISVSIANIGCTHGRDSKGRRLLPVMLKDVAGLVPGAYQGRGRGNKVST